MENTSGSGMGIGGTVVLFAVLIVGAIAGLNMILESSGTSLIELLGM